MIRSPGGNSDDRLSLADQAREIEITPFLLGSVVDRNPQTAAVAGPPPRSPLTARQPKQTAGRPSSKSVPCLILLLKPVDLPVLQKAAKLLADLRRNHPDPAAEARKGKPPVWPPPSLRRRSAPAGHLDLQTAENTPYQFSPFPSASFLFLSHSSRYRSVKLYRVFP